MDYLESNACSSTDPSEVTITAEIVNQTNQVLDMHVGNSVYFVHMAHLARGATHTVLVDYSDTYQEYKFSPLRSSTGESSGSSSSSSNLVVTSDECCDYKRITITEVDGQLAVQREPRVYSGEWNLQNISPAAPPPPLPPLKLPTGTVGSMSEIPTGSGGFGFASFENQAYVRRQQRFYIAHCRHKPKN